jgi:hypothetical protein
VPKIPGLDIDEFRKLTRGVGKKKPIEEAVSPERRHIAMLQKALADAKESASRLWSLSESRSLDSLKEREQVYFAIDKLEAAVSEWKPVR